MIFKWITSLFGEPEPAKIVVKPHNRPYPKKTNTPVEIPLPKDKTERFVMYYQQYLLKKLETDEAFADDIMRVMRRWMQEDANDPGRKN